VIFLELARYFLKKLYKTMVCNTFSFHEIFHTLKTTFASCIATIENAFRATHKMEKDMQIQAIPPGS